MNRNIKLYMIAWIIALVAFNIIAFVLRDEVFIFNKNNFWVDYIAIMLGFIVQAGCSIYYASKSERKQRFLYVPVIVIGYITLLVFFSLAIETIKNQFMPTWLALSIAVAVMAYYLLAVIQSVVAAGKITEIDERIEQQTNFMRSITAESNALHKMATPELKKITQEVYDNLRYSNPSSSENVLILEEKLYSDFKTFSEAVKDGNKDLAEKIAKSIKNTTIERNELCKIDKQRN